MMLVVSNACCAQISPQLVIDALVTPSHGLSPSCGSRVFTSIQPTLRPLRSSAIPMSVAVRPDCGLVPESRMTGI